MKKAFLFFAMVAVSFHVKAQSSESNTYWQVKSGGDFLELIVNQSIVARLDYGFGRYIVGLCRRFWRSNFEFDNDNSIPMRIKSIFA